MYRAYYVVGRNLMGDGEVYGYHYWHGDVFSGLADEIGFSLGAVVDDFTGELVGESGWLEFEDHLSWVEIGEGRNMYSSEWFEYRDGEERVEVRLFNDVLKFESYLESCGVALYDEDDCDPRGDLASDRFREMGGLDN